MRLTRAEREETERRIREDFEIVRGLTVSMETLRAGLSDPSPFICIRAATAILRQANKQRGREMLRRLAELERQLTGSAPVRLSLAPSGVLQKA